MARKATPCQLAFMLDFMRDHPAMASGHVGTGLQGKIKMEKLWKELAEKLQALEGPPKSVMKWKQTWRDLRSSYKKKGMQSLELPAPAPASQPPAVVTGNGSTNIQIEQVVQTPNTIEEQVWVKLEPMVVSGMEDVPITEPASESSTDVLLVLDKNLDDVSVSTEPVQVPSSPSPIPQSVSLPPLRSTPMAQFSSQPKKRKRITKRLEHFDERILRLEEEKLNAKKAHYAALEVTEERKAAALHRIADVLQHIFD